MPEPNRPGIVDAHGQPARRAINDACPQCGAAKDARVLSAGFGSPHDVCSVCGHDFDERTV